jgi:hypothetical protein
MLLFTIIVYCILATYEFIPLYREKLWNDFLTNAVLWLSSFTFAILLCLDVKIPSPEEPIREFITSLFGK